MTSKKWSQNTLEVAIDALMDSNQRRDIGQSNHLAASLRQAEDFLFSCLGDKPAAPRKNPAKLAAAVIARQVASARGGERWKERLGGRAAVKKARSS